jgi:hypothetical protein
MDTEKLMWHFLQCENYDLTTLQKEMPTILKTITDEENDFDEKVKLLTKDNLTEQLNTVKQARAELLASRAKTVEEKRHELYKAVDNKSIIEKLAEQAIAAGPEVKFEVDIFDLLKGDKDDVEKNVTTVIKDHVAKLGDNAAEDEQKAKSD